MIRRFLEGSLENTLKRKIMNRSRRLYDYNYSFDLDIQKLAREKINEKGVFNWYDICCGNFFARDDLLEQEHKFHDKINAIGVDLDVRREKVIYADARTFKIPKEADLVTCLWGLGWIQEYTGEGASTIQNWYNSLGEGTILTFDARYRNIMVENEDVGDHLKKVLDKDVEIFHTPGRYRGTHKTIRVYCKDREINLLN